MARTPRIYQRVSQIPSTMGPDEPRAIAAASRERKTGDDAAAEWREVIVPLEIDGAVHRVKIRGIDLGVVT